MADASKGFKPIIFIGAGDKICGETVKLIVEATDVPVVLADSDEAALREFAAKLARTVTIRKLDLFNPEELRSVISDAAFVVQGAQPYHSTSTPVIKACIDVKVPYLDYSDDVKSTQESLALHDRAMKQGVPCYINCGLSPGMSNVIAVDICKEFDTTESLDICWLVSEEAGGLGREVLEHLMHITAGPCLTWVDGKGVVHENWVEKTKLPVLSGGDDLVYESVHPEPVTLPRQLPNVKRIRTGGAFNPVPFNGFARGLGAAVNSGALSMDEAIDFLLSLQKPSSASWTETLGAINAQLRGGDITLNQLYQLASGGLASLKPWNFAIWGMIEQIRNGECTVLEAFCYLVNSARGKKASHRSGMMVRGVGTKNGHPAVIVKRIPNIGPGSLLGGKMPTAIGASCAAFILLALDQGPQKRPGVYCPEDWADAEAFYGCLERIGCEWNHIVESM